MRTRVLYEENRMHEFLFSDNDGLQNGARDDELSETLFNRLMNMEALCFAYKRGFDEIISPLKEEIVFLRFEESASGQQRSME